MLACGMNARVLCLAAAACFPIARPAVAQEATPRATPQR